MINKKEKIRKYLILLFAKYVIRYYQYIHHLLISYFKKENNPKIFCIGYVKTGTTSLYKALSILGYRSVKMLRGCVKPKEGWINYIKSCKYDAYTDYPMFVDNFFKEIDKAYPNSKFILTIRDTNSWLKSYTNYYFVSSDFSKNEGKQKLIEHNKKVIAYFKDKPSRLLVMNIIDGDGWEKLCKFLNKPVPNKPFPHKNIGKYKIF